MLEEPLDLRPVLNRSHELAPAAVKPAAPEYMEGSSRGRDSTRTSNENDRFRHTAHVIRCVASATIRSALAATGVLPAAGAFLRRRGAFAPAATGKPAAREYLERESGGRDSQARDETEEPFGYAQGRSCASSLSTRSRGDITTALTPPTHSFFSVMRILPSSVSSTRCAATAGRQTRGVPAVSEANEP